LQKTSRRHDENGRSRDSQPESGAREGLAPEIDGNRPGRALAVDNVLNERQFLSTAAAPASRLVQRRAANRATPHVVDGVL
jgi:hypothetical protein